MIDWDDFDSGAYVAQNYGHRILPEDMQLMRFVASELRHLQVPPDSLRMTADVGAGPNLYPGLLLTPYISPLGSLELIDYSAANLRYLCKALDDACDEATVWSRFEHYLSNIGHRTSLQRLRQMAEVKAGNILELPAGKYDAITCFFVMESITADPNVFAAGLSSLMRSLKPGGLFITAHMVGSQFYKTGPEAFPACSLTFSEIEKSYEPYGSFRSILTAHSPQQAVRPGYDGMAALVGRLHA
jgi:SAM-dependent methyltransferase